jgi:hypothetical protein
MTRIASTGLAQIAKTHTGDHDVRHKKGIPEEVLTEAVKNYLAIGSSRARSQALAAKSKLQQTTTPRTTQEELKVSQQLARNIIRDLKFGRLGNGLNYAKRLLEEENFTYQTGKAGNESYKKNGVVVHIHPNGKSRVPAEEKVVDAIAAVIRARAIGSLNRDTLTA